MRRLLTPLVAVLIALPSVGGDAEAGVLGQTARSVSNKQSPSSSGSSGGGRSSSGPRSSDSSGSSWDSDRGSSVDHRGRSSRRRARRQARYNAAAAGGVLFVPGASLACFSCPSPGQVPSPFALELDLRLGMQNVRNSDQSYRGRIRMHLGPLGIQLRGDQYQENISGKSPDGFAEEEVRINFSDASALLRVVDSPVLRAHFHIGVARTSSTHFDPMSGAVIGLDAQVALSPMAFFEVAGRAINFDDNLDVLEASASVHLKAFYAGYRTLSFTDAPALHGPELGLSIRL